MTTLLFLVENAKFKMANWEVGSEAALASPEMES